MSRKENWTFLHVGDSHMGTPRSYRFRPAINRRWAAIKRQMAAIDADLLLHGGDLTRDGDTHEFAVALRGSPGGDGDLPGVLRTCRWSPVGQ